VGHRTGDGILLPSESPSVTYAVSMTCIWDRSRSATQDSRAIRHFEGNFRVSVYWHCIGTLRNKISGGESFFLTAIRYRRCFEAVLRRGDGNLSSRRFDRFLDFLTTFGLNTHLCISALAHMKIFLCARDVSRMVGPPENSNQR
jgi:hypothetical protein